MKNEQKIMFWLTIDMKGSTEKTAPLSNNQLKDFNLAFIDQIRPHLTKLGLADAHYKFTGDGWVFAVSSEKVRNLACLATIMAQKFQEEMASILVCKTKEIPPLRLAICAGLDTQVELPNGNTDWVGDGARYSVRASARCYDNEIIIDDSTRTIVNRDFVIGSFFNEPKRPKSKNEREEPYTKHILKNLKSKVASGSNAPDFLVYTRDVLEGKVKPETVKTVKHKSVKSNIDVHGETSTINIFVKPPKEGISSGAFDIAFDADNIQVEKVTPGNFFASYTNKIGPIIDQENGTISVALMGTQAKPSATPAGTYQATQPSATPAGTYVSLQVRTTTNVSQGVYPFEVKNISFSDENFKVVNPDKVKISLKAQP